MPQFSHTSLEKLQLCHKDLIIVFMVVIKYFDCTIIESYRSKKRQDRVFNEGLSQVHYPSYHNCQPAFAVDVAPYERKGVDWNEKQLIYFNGFVMGIAHVLFDNGEITHEVISGLDWNSDHDINDTKFFDADHFFIKPLKGEKMFFVP